MNSKYDMSGVLFKNDKGDNPKRPDYRGSITVAGVDYNISGNAPCGESLGFEDGSYAFAEGFSIETQETYPDDGCDMPHDSVILWMIPESKEEQEELSGVAAILPSKWSYCACIVPFSDVEL